mgnify:CR=1 FL=1
MYGKLIDAHLHLAPKCVIIEGKKSWNADKDTMLSLGWKPLVFTAVPEDVPGFYFESTWKETAKKITQSWEKKEIPDDVSPEDALAELMEVIG